MLWPDQAAECIARQARRVSFVGHSHVALFFASPEDRGRSEEPDARPGRPGRRRDGRSTSPQGRWLINPGSVGQPRDGDPRAAWLELDTEAWRATYDRVEYEIDRAAEAIMEADLPEHLARRLFVGQ